MSHNTVYKVKNMPELPEVETIKKAVEKGIGNAKILDIDVRNRKLREEIPCDLEQKLIGATILKHERIAKYIVISLDNDFCIIWHMGMSGKVKISDTEPLAEKHDHIILKTNNGFITYNDPRRFGLFTYCSNNNLENSKFFRNLGKDPFGDGLTVEYLFEKLQKKKKTPIKVALLDQSIISGIGNIYASEILYESRILPSRLCESIGKKDCKTIIEKTKIVLQKAIDAGGSTLRDYKKPDGSLGYFQNMHCVYNKKGQKCPHCICDIKKTGGIKSVVMAGRSTFYCESLQK